MNLKERAVKLKKNIPAVFIALKDSETPITAKVLACLTVAYALSPIDLVPDFIPVLGYLDDIILLPAMIALTVKLIPQSVWERSQRLAEANYESAGKKRWYYAVPTIAIWLLLAWLIIKVIFFR